MTGWPRPPLCLVAADLVIPPNGARVAVAGLVVCRQRPGTANVVVWARAFERFRRAVISGRCLKVTGRLQRDGDVTHVVADAIEDASPLLDEIVGVAALPEPAEWPHSALSSRG